VSDVPGNDDAAVDQPFSRRALFWVIGVGVASFVLAIVLAIFMDDPDGTPTAGNDSYSRSALGHKGFVELLEDYDIRVVRSRHTSGTRAGDHALLLVAEPRLGTDEQKEKLGHMLEAARHAVLVLPKRAGYPDPQKRAWIDESELRPQSDASDVLAAAGITGNLVRPDHSQSFTSPLGEGLPSAPELHNPQVVAYGEGQSVFPLVESEAGVLVARVHILDDPDDEEGRDLIVIADPDLIANHGLGDGDNAAIALAALEKVRPAGAVVVVDETMHGHVATPSLWRELFSFPLSLATTTVLMALVLLLWSAMGRFGKPLPPERALAAGKRSLIDNTAELTRYGGHAAHALERYLHATVQDVARASHAPAHLGPAELREWLLRAARARHVGLDLVALEREVAEIAGPAAKGPRLAARALATAGRIHRWRQEMTNGSAGHSRAS